MIGIKSLIKKLNDASYAYYNSGKPIISDSEYDKLYSELERLEAKTGIIYSNSPTQNVGAKAIDTLKKIKHSFPMLSLAKCHTAAELKKFIGNNNGILMLKMDGLTIRATYNDGELITLETRGDGYEGNDVTHLIGNFVNLPRKIRHTGELIIDGECIITYQDFERINAKLPKDQEPYKNPRNLASGTLAARNSEDVFDRPLRFIAWRVIKGLEESNSLYSQTADIYNMSFETVICEYVEPDKIDENKLEEKLNQLRERAKIIGYPIDGIVFAFDSISFSKKLGFTAHHFNHSIAYKFEDDKYPTRVIDIEWTGGKTGTLTPTLIFEPVEIDGTSVQRASLHNVSIFKQLHPTKNCTAYVYKANQIIPQCDSCEDDGFEDFIIPTKCPICGFDTVIEKNNNTEFLICSNDDCQGRLIKKLCTFVGRQGFDIDGMSEATLERFVELGWINDFMDIFNLDKHYSEMVRLEGFGVISSQKLLKAIDDSRKISMDKFLTALSIPGIGVKAGRQIAEEYEFQLQPFLDDLKSGNTTKLHRINGVGDVLVKQILKWFKQQIYMDSIVKYLTFTIPNISNKISCNQKLSGKNICVTGKLCCFKNREELAKTIELMGGKEVTSVTKKTSYLLTNDKSSGSSKNKKAAELNIPIISEEEFIELCGIEV